MLFTGSYFLSFPTELLFHLAKNHYILPYITYNYFILV